MSAKITFYGGAGTVTGANFLLDTGAKKLLIDCGALEREDSTQVCDEENLKPFAYDPASADALFITHAHQDHIGRVPKLVRDGFRGAIYSTPATKDLSAIMFEDALGIMRNQFERHGCAPMYEQADADKALSLWRTREYRQTFTLPQVSRGLTSDSAKSTELPSGGLTSEISVELLDAGHILGSTMVRFSRNGRTIIFTGDIGNSPEPLLNDVEAPGGANYLVMESVYGDRVHEDRAARRELLRSAIESSQQKRETLLIPSFSIERTQVLLFEIKEMIEKKEIATVPVYLDAPLAIHVTEIFERYKNELKPEAAAQAHGGRPLFSFPGFVEMPTPRDSREIHTMPDPKIVIAGAGMSSGGRVRAHEKRYLPDEHATILQVGYQAPGSLGRRIQDGQKTVSIDGEKISVNARVLSLTGYSGHADRDQLLSFVEHAGDTLKEAFVVMGEPKASAFLAQRLKEYLGVEAVVPAQNDSVNIDW